MRRTPLPCSHVLRIVLACVLFAMLPITSEAKPNKAKATPSKDLPKLKRSGKFRTRRCWKLYKKVQKTIRRWVQLHPRLAIYSCEERWSTCQKRPTQECKKMKQTFDLCYRIDRRMFVITRRLREQNQSSRKWRCRWRLKLPKKRFLKPRFAPDRKRFKRRR